MAVKRPRACVELHVTNDAGTDQVIRLVPRWDDKPGASMFRAGAMAEALRTLSYRVSDPVEVPLICNRCAKHNHDTCRGGTWCDCQHQAPQVTQEELDAADELSRLGQELALTDEPMPV